MTMRICSSLVTVLLLVLLSVPALAEKGDKNKGDDDAAGDESGEVEATEPDVWERPPPEEEKPKPKKSAPAEEPVGDGLDLAIGFNLGFGFEFDDAFPGSNPYGPGLALRVGHTLDMQLYVGFYYAAFVGLSKQDVDMYVGYSTYWGTPALEVGYDFWFDSVILRPSLGAGIAISYQDRGRPTIDPAQTNAYFYLLPALTVIYTWDDFYLGGELAIHHVTGGGVGGVFPAVSFGMRFDSEELF